MKSEKVFDYIALYDFWSIFGAGAVVGVSTMIVWFDKINKIIPVENNLQIFCIFILIIVFYVIGLILHSISSLIVELPIFSFKTDNITEPIKNKAPHKYYWKRKYVLQNESIVQKTLQKGFKKCYNYLKLNNKTNRVDKYHSIYGMARSLSLGYVFIAAAMLVNGKFDDYSIGYLSICLVLAILFFIRAKKYFYRWVELVFIQYQFEIEMEEKGKCVKEF